MMPTLSTSEFEQLLIRCASLPDVRREVIRNHDDNIWWPRRITDWRLRMLIAGLTTRVSYAMVTTYQEVVQRLNEIGYDHLSTYKTDELSKLVSPLGLKSNRVHYCESMFEFIKDLQRRDTHPASLSNDELIGSIAERVFGASYKVGQCCTLNAKGYYCGIIPVDSGMKDKLSICLGMDVVKTAYGHELMRKQLESYVAEIDCRKIAIRTGYEGLSFPTEGPLSWWSHLVLIYYKRLYCNRPAARCPLIMGQESRDCALHKSN